MIRDPSDGSVQPSPRGYGSASREKISISSLNEDKRIVSTVIDTSTSGLPITKAKADYLARLEESRKWLKAYVRPTIIEKGQ